MPFLSTFGAASARSKGRGLRVVNLATPISTNLGFPLPSSQGSREYYFTSRKMTLFYDDMYGSTAHITLPSGVSSYTDVRHIANNDGQDTGANTCLVNVSGNYVGYKFDLPVQMKGVRVYGAYAGVGLSSQGTLTVETWDGTTWTVQNTITGSSVGGQLNSANGFAQDFSSTRIVRGVRIKHSSTSTYCPYSYFAGYDANGNAILGVQ